MKILIINPPHLSIGSRMPREHLPPLGLLSIGGPLIDAGHDVKLLDSEFGPLTFTEIVSRVFSSNPDAILLGHSGSTSAQPIINDITKLVRAENPNIKIIIGGVFPTYHWEEILEKNPQIDYVVCGEGEEIALQLITALDTNAETESIRGLAFRKNGLPIKTLGAETLKSLDNYRTGWELMNGYNYTYWGKRKAVVIQFSRGCPYPCTYCGQSFFWKKWRHRDPQLLADEIEVLHKDYGILVFNFADENPSSNPRA
jgi:anaerobic magnesium-protoporphyrin IX monomethyl ester cyclase